MKRDDISTLAEAAGLNYTVDLQHDGKHHIRLDGWLENFERFAQLVAAQAAAEEREACAKVCFARASELATALLSDPDHVGRPAGSFDHGCMLEAERLSDVIRARGTA